MVILLLQCVTMLILCIDGTSGFYIIPLICKHWTKFDNNIQKYRIGILTDIKMKKNLHDFTLNYNVIKSNYPFFSLNDKNKFSQLL